MIFHVSAEEEARALRRSAERVGCRVRALASRDVAGVSRAVGQVECPDGWGAARMLLALANEDARTPGARALALEIRKRAPSDRAFAEELHRFVKARVRFVREIGEVFQGGGYTLAAGAGDCDDHARLVYALARAGGLSAVLAFLYREEGGGPTHAVAQLWDGAEYRWAETTIDARFGEHPLEAASRLGLLRSRRDIAKGVRVMGEKDLPPIPARYLETNPSDRVDRDAAMLERLGFLCIEEPIGDAADPVFRAAVAAFQRTRRGLRVDGLIGPKTRAELLRALPNAIGELAPVEVRLTKHLSPAFFRDVVAMAGRFRARGANVKAENLLGVWLAESGLRSSIQNAAGAAYYGLNQMGTTELRNVGWTGTPGEWLALTPEEQRPFVERYYEINVRAFASGNWSKLDGPGSLYLMNFLPAKIVHSDDPRHVLARRSDDAPSVSAPESEWAAYRKAHPRDFYAWNRGLDVDRKGFIEVADMTKAIARAQQNAGAYWIEVRRRLYSEGEGAGADEGGGSTSGLVVAAALLGTGALAAWHVWGG